MSDGSRGGDDVLWASARGARLVGDAVAIQDTSSGGADDLRGDAGSDVIFGDASGAMTGAAKGGDDALRGRAGADELFGDALELRGSSRGGDDQLYSGAGNDRLWGDGRLFGQAEGGDDVFHFAGAFGDDKVLDFRRGEDKLAFTGILRIDVEVDTVGGNTVVATLAGDSVTLLDFTGQLTFGKDILFFG
jgi:serralysin